MSSGVVSWIATEVGSTTDVTSVGEDDDGAGAGVADETGAWNASAVVYGATADVETTEVATLVTFSEVDI